MHEANRKLLTAFGFVRGVTHAEFIRSRDDGQFYFLEVAARVGGANIAELVEASTGINLWAEWAKIEIEQGDNPYQLPQHRSDYGGLITSLARQEHPDTSAYNDPEIVWRLQKRHHVSFIVASTELERVTQLIDSYTRRIHDEFYASMPPPESATN